MKGRLHVGVVGLYVSIGGEIVRKHRRNPRIRGSTPSKSNHSSLRPDQLSGIAVGGRRPRVCLIHTNTSVHARSADPNLLLPIAWPVTAHAAHA